MSETYDVPEELHYTKEHEWVKVFEDGRVQVGVTDYAQKSLHEVVFIELPGQGDRVKQADILGAVESVKAVSDLFSPVSGTIDEVNEELSDSPELINSDPYGKGWVAIITPRNLTEELESLLSPEAYREHLVSLKE